MIPSSTSKCGRGSIPVWSKGSSKAVSHSSQCRYTRSKDAYGKDFTEGDVDNSDVTESKGGRVDSVVTDSLTGSIG